MKTKLRDNPNLKWRGVPVWDPPAWQWIHSTGLMTSPAKLEQGKLVNARMFKDEHGTAAVELSVAFDGLVCSTLLRFDNSKSAAGLTKQLNELQGFTLKQIDTMELAEI